MWKNTEVAKRLNIEAPVILGPFGGGASSIDLVAQVSEGGGLGSYGANHLSGEEIKKIAQDIRSRTSKPFALNIWVPFEGSETQEISDEAFANNCQLLKPYFDELKLPLPDRPERFWPSFNEQVEAVLEAKPHAFSFVFGIPPQDILDRCKSLNIITIGTATTVAEAVALDQAGVDLIVATGFEAGGHRVSFLKPAEESLMGTFALIPQVVDQVKAPVIAAGGIADGRGITAALALGASGVQIGTAFLACEESAANKLHRKILWDKQTTSTTLTRAFSGRLARGVENRLVRELKTHESKLPPYPIQNWFTSKLKAAAVAQGRSDLISLWAGQSAPLISHHHAEALLKSLYAETDRCIAKFTSSKKEH